MDQHLTQLSILTLHHDISIFSIDLHLIEYSTQIFWSRLIFTHFVVRTCVTISHTLLTLHYMTTNLFLPYYKSKFLWNDIICFWQISVDCYLASCFLLYAYQQTVYPSYFLSLKYDDSPVIPCLFLFIGKLCGFTLLVMWNFIHPAQILDETPLTFLLLYQIEV